MAIDIEIYNNLENYIKSHANYAIKYIKKMFYNAYLQDILDKYNLSLIELCYRIKHNIALDFEFKCQFCGKKIKFNDKKYRYPKFCSLTCSGKHNMQNPNTLDKIRKINIQKYGHSNPMKNPDISKKAYSNKLKKNNGDLSFIYKKVRQKCLELYGAEHYLQTQEGKSKFKQTCLRNLGVDNPSKSDKVKQKKIEKSLETYGTEYILQAPSIREQIVKTNNIKYGCDHYMQTQEGKDRVKQTNIEKRGVPYYTQTQEHKDYIKIHNNEIQQKRHNTNKNNGTYTKSKAEDKVYSLLLTKFNEDDIIRQYESADYPFPCDFYIKSLNLYIEFNGYWTHGKEPFDLTNSEHVKILDKWNNKSKELNFKSKQKKQYLKAIYTWTDLDVRKLETFKKNKLNYKIFWNVQDAENWLRGF